MRDLALNMACTEDEVLPLRPLILRAYSDAKARGWPFLSDVLEAAGRGIQEGERAVLAAALHAMTRYDRLTGFVTQSEEPGARLDALLALSRPDSEAARRASERLEQLDAKERLGIRYSLPDWIVDVVGDESLLARLNETPPRVARVNTLKTTRETCLNALDDEGLTAYATRHASHGIVFEGRRSPFRTKAFARGDFEMQDEASQLVAELVAPPPKSFVVDACAGAGGKTLALAAQLGGKGKVLALEPSKSKLAELRRRARRAGASNVQALAGELATLELEGPPSRVLVDAPCSGLGAMRRNPEARWRLRREDLERLGEVQAALVDGAATMVPDGGRLIYATCSFLPYEGERVVESFLERHPEFVLMTARDVMGRARTEGVATPDGKYLRTWQAGGGGDASMDGFFGAVLRRRAASSTASAPSA
jgi:16S rRNA (cytosine967-C5)-methyltransferase